MHPPAIEADRALGRDSLPQLNTLWVEGPLTWLEQVCLTSAIATGHSVCLYCYGKVFNVPDGVEVRDARDIMPFERMVRHKSSSSWSLGSDLFRYEILRQGKGIWIDSDVYFLKAIQTPKDQTLFAWQKEGLINGAVLWWSPVSGMTEEIDAFLSQKHLIPYWRPWHNRLPYQIRAWLDLQPLALEDHKWGIAGPRAITWAARKRGLAEQALPAPVFYPYGPKRAREAFDPNADIMSMLHSSTVAIHLWNEAIKHLKKTAPPTGSFMWKICQDHGIKITDD